MENKRLRWLKFENSSARKSTLVGETNEARIPEVISDEDHIKLVTSASEERLNFDKDSTSNLHLTPCTWSITEKQSFVLGIYLFYRNFNLVNVFMGNKGLGNILSYYYGKFYKTATYKEWILSRKINDQIVKPTGLKVFAAGWRQQELLGRIFEKCSDECKTHLTRATRMFNYKETSFMTYLCIIRDLVGFDLLVEAVAIGNEKKDLTRIKWKPSKNKSVLKPFKYLKTEEVISLLKYDIKLDKKQLHALFNEAVWPRLLRNGWHSQTKTNSPDLVFLAPGIKKFTGRGQVVRTDYFECFLDVVHKVSLEPQLLESDYDKNMLVNPPENQISDKKQDSVQGKKKIKLVTMTAPVMPTLTPKETPISNQGCETSSIEIPEKKRSVEGVAEGGVDKRQKV